MTPRVGFGGVGLRSAVGGDGAITVLGGGRSGTEYIRLRGGGSFDRTFAQFGRLDDVTVSATAESVAGDGSIIAVGT